MKIKGGDKGWSHQAVWADADRYLEERLAEEELDAHDRAQKKAAEVEAGPPPAEHVIGVEIQRG